MFSTNRRLQSFFKLKISLTLFLLLLIAFAFTNFFILFSLKTDVHLRPESLLESVFLIHFHGNVSVYGRDEHDTQKLVVLHKSRESQIKTKPGDTLNETHAKIDKKIPVTLPKRKSQTGVPNAITKSVKQFRSKKPHQTISNKITTSPKTSNEETRHVQPNKNCTAWCYRGNGLKPPYLLTAVLLVRIYRHDLAKLSSREMIQWLQYLRYAGFQHVYIYDAYLKPSESQSDVIRPFVQSGFATYIDWSIHNPYTIQGTQVAAYQDCIDKFGKDSKWQAAIDIDEYPFSPTDFDQNFMSRFLAKYSKNNPDVSEITMKNFLFLGKPIDDAKEPLLMARIRRRTHVPANALVKPIYKPANIAWAQVHHNGVRTGSSRDSPEALLRMNHYWGARLQNWGDDTPKILDMTQPDYTIEPIVDRIKYCARFLGEDGLYVTKWA